MNYIKELNAFYDQLTFNPLSASANALWHTLMHFNNKTGWQTSFSVPASMLEVMSGVKGTTFKRARTELIEQGFINVTSGIGSQAATYEMISQIKTFTAQEESNVHIEETAEALMDHDEVNDHSMTAVFYVDQTPDNTDDHSSDYNPDHNSDHKPAPLFKQYINKNKTKPNKIIITTATGFYRQHFGMASTYIAEDIEQWINDMSDPLVLDAMKRALEQNKPRWGYVKGILRAWKSKGIRTVEEAETADQQFRNKSQTSYRYAEKAEVIPAWFHERRQKQIVCDEIPIYSEAEREECEQLLAKYGKKQKVSS